jgi:hypothetical protein
MPKRNLFIFLFFSCIFGSLACTPQLPEPDLDHDQQVVNPLPKPDLDHNLHIVSSPFLAIWEEQSPPLGPPLSAPLWIDGRLVQFFERVRLEFDPAREDVSQPSEAPARTITVQTLEPDWQERLPQDLLQLETAPQQAYLVVEGNPTATAEPLQPLTLALQIPDYSGTVELRLYDAQLRQVDRVTAQVQDGAASLTVLPRGVLGPQWAIALVEGRIAGAWSAFLTLDATTTIETGQADLDSLYPAIRSFMEQSAVTYELDERRVHGYRSPDNPLLWLRDHVHQGRGFRYFESDVTSLLDAFRRAQFPDGSFPDVVDYPDRFMSAHRKEVESDLEYLFVQGVYEAWQMTGDNEWLRQNLPAMRRGLQYIMSDPLRWDAEYGLVRRPYTIDTWDFEFGPTTISPDGKPAPRHWIDDRTVWGIFHGDNTGLALALELMARIEELVGDPMAAGRWREQARGVMQRLNDLAWNGRFFTHFVHAEGPERGQSPAVPGVDTTAQLSLSNAYALNRGVLDRRQGRTIVETYFERRDFNRAFAEWYSIDPPFPPGSYGLGGRPGENPGEYVNGGIMPLVGGELARGAFHYGAEPYGFDILLRYAQLIGITDSTYLWYYPNGAPGISGVDTIATDGWGASAMLGALVEGAAGIEDHGKSYSSIVISPRWAAQSDTRSARIVARYAASDGYVAYTWQRNDQSLTLDLTGSWQYAYVRLLLPEGVPDQVRVEVNGTSIPHAIEGVGHSRYVVLDADNGNITAVVHW